MGGGETYKARHTKPTQQQRSEQRMTKVSRSPGNLCVCHSRPGRKQPRTRRPPSGLTTLPTQGSWQWSASSPPRDPLPWVSVELDFPSLLCLFSQSDVLTRPFLRPQSLERDRGGVLPPLPSTTIAGVQEGGGLTHTWQGDQELGRGRGLVCKDRHVILQSVRKDFQEERTRIRSAFQTPHFGSGEKGEVEELRHGQEERSQEQRLPSRTELRSHRSRLYGGRDGQEGQDPGYCGGSSGALEVREDTATQTSCFSEQADHGRGTGVGHSWGTDGVLGHQRFIRD